MNTNKMQKAAPFLVAAAAVLWGVLVVFVRKLNTAGFEAMDIVGIRVYGSARCFLSGEVKRNETFIPAARIVRLHFG